MKKVSPFLLAALFLFGPQFSSAQQDGFFTKTTSLPYWRHSYDALITPMNKLYSVGGWDTNDAITSAFESQDTGMSWSAKMDYVNTPVWSVCFASDSTAFVVGRDGLAMKSTDAGSNYSSMNIPGNPGSRNFNEVYFIDSQNGFIVGGNESNDSIQTMLRTTDGGANWSVVSDNLGPWLRGIHFPTSTVGFAVGDMGTILKTTDGGSNWSTQTAPGNTSNRQFHSVFFTDADNGIIVGGHPDNDSIQTIIRTTDGGTNWSLISDNLGSMLLDVWMRSAQKGFAVGDDGTILETNDGGANWTAVTLDGAVNDDEPLTSVYFENEHRGIFGGKVGKIILYEDTTVVLPDAPEIISVSQARLVIVNNNLVEVRLDAAVNGKGETTTLSFEVGTDSNNTTSTSAIPGQISDSADNDVFAKLTSLQPDELYYYRFKAENVAGITYSPFYQFHTGINNIPNWSFEQWDTLNTERIDDWTQFGLVSKVPSFDSSNAVRLQGEGQDTPGVILHGQAGDNGIEGGVPYTERPDSIAAYFNYDIATGDSAFILLMMKENGNMISQNMYFIDGNSGGNFNRMAFPINYQNANNPDSMILAFGSTNVLGGNFDASSVLIVDDVTFINASTVPNADMEAWTLTTQLKPVDWYGVEDYDGNQLQTLHQSTEAKHENFSIKIQNDSLNPTGELSLLSSINQSGNQADFAVNAKHQTFNGYYQFNPGNGNDTMIIRMFMYAGGQIIGEANMEETSMVGSWQPFALDINYYQNVQPDSGRIEVLIMNNGNAGLDSYVMLDNFSFDGFIADNITSVPVIPEVMSYVNLYPNPANELVNIEIETNTDELGMIQIYTLAGACVKTIPAQNIYSGTTTIPIYTDGMPSGMYAVIIHLGNRIISKKLIVN